MLANTRWSMISIVSQVCEQVKEIQKCQKFNIIEIPPPTAHIWHNRNGNFFLVHVNIHGTFRAVLMCGFFIPPLCSGSSQMFKPSLPPLRYIEVVMNWISHHQLKCSQGEVGFFFFFFFLEICWWMEKLFCSEKVSSLRRHINIHLDILLDIKIKKRKLR